MKEHIQKLSAYIAERLPVMASRNKETDTGNHAALANHGKTYRY